MKNIIVSFCLMLCGFFTKAQTSNPITNQDLAHNLARADTCFAHQQYQEAYNWYNDVKSYYPNNGKIYRRLGYILSISVKGEADAIVMLKKAIAIDSTDKVSYYYLSVCYIALAKQTNDSKIKAQNKALAATNINKAIELGNEDAKALLSDLNGI